MHVKRLAALRWKLVQRGVDDRQYVVVLNRSFHGRRPFTVGFLLDVALLELGPAELVDREVGRSLEEKRLRIFERFGVVEAIDA